MNRTSRIIAVLQMVGGAWGLGTSLWFLPDFLGEVIPLIFMLIFIGLFTLTIGAGWLLWRGDHRGIIASIVVQALQVVQLSVGGFTYYLFAPIDLSVLLRIVQEGSNTSGNLNFDMNFGTQWELTFGQPDGMMFFGLNIIAILFLVHLIGRLRQSEEPTPALADGPESL